MKRLLFSSNDMFAAALVISTAVHCGIWGVISFLPQRALYSVRQASQAVRVTLIKETFSREEVIAKSLPDEPKSVSEPVTETPEEIITSSVSEKKAVEVAAEEITEGIPSETAFESTELPGAIFEAMPLEFSNPSPEYPYLARQRGWEGLVLVEVRVEKDGTLSSANITQSSGYKILDNETLQAIRTWRFRPAQRGSSTFASTIKIPVRFQLTN